MIPYAFKLKAFTYTSILTRLAAQANNELATFKSSSKFYQAWTLENNFAAFARKNFTLEVCHAELGRQGELEKSVDRLQGAVDSLKAMHKVARGMQKES